MGFSPKRVTWGHLGSSGLPRFLEPIQLTTGPLEAYWPLPECSVVQAFTGYGPISTWAADEMNDSRTRIRWWGRSPGKRCGIWKV